jgi:small neutral amino acid transporter SnatA (MarC family)
VNSVRVRVAYVVTLSMVALVALATPAAAAPAISGSVVLANEKFKWFYWIGFVLAASMALWLLRTAVMYYFKVIRPKHRGRETS